MELTEFTKDLFKGLSPESDGTINLLISGNFNESELNSGSWNTGSWKWNSSTPNTASINSSYAIKGITISFKDKQGNNVAPTLRVCNNILLHYSLGNTTVDKIVDIKGKTFYGNYAFFDVDETVEASPGNIEIYFKSGSSGSASFFEGYDCKDSEERIQSFSPQFRTEEETSVFNPIINNVFSNRLSTHAWVVELFYSGGIPEEKTTVTASVADSFYTQIANVSGRYLGSKNSLVTKYTGKKNVFTEDVQRIVSNSLVEYTASGDTVSIAETGKDRVFFEAAGFTGSVFLSGSIEEAIAEIGIANMKQEPLKFVKGAVVSIESAPVLDISVPRIGTLPELGDVLYDDSVEYRLTEAKIYSSDLNKILVTDVKGHIREIVDVNPPVTESVSEEV